MDGFKRFIVAVVVYILVLTAASACGNDRVSDEIAEPTPRGRLKPGLLEPAEPLTDEERVGPQGSISPYALTGPIPGSRMIAFPSLRDDTALVGRLFGDDGRRKLGVLLLNSSSTDMRTWIPLGKELMDDGYSVFSFDFRGYGQSMGERDPARYPEDADTGLEVLRLFGVDDIVVVGTEVGGTAGVAAAAASKWVKGVVTIGSAPTFESLDATAAARKLDVPALVLAGPSSNGEELRGLISGAQTEAVSIEGEPEKDPDVMASIRRFVEGAIGTP